MTTTSRGPQAELEPMRLMISSIIRRSWLIVGCVLLVVGGTWVATGLGENTDDEVTAVSRVGITTEVVWPFYDVVLEQGRTMVAEPDFENELEATLGFPIAQIRTMIPDALSVFDIEVVADTPDHAVEAADAAAKLVVERWLTKASEDTSEDIASLDVELAQLDGRIDEIRARIDIANAQLAEIAAAQAVDFDPVADEQRYAISLDRDVDQSVITDLEREHATKVGQRADLVASPVPDAAYEVLRLAESPAENSSARLPITLAAGFTALLVACAAVVAVDRRRGPVRAPWQLRQVCGADVVDEVTTRNGAFSGTGAIADRLHGAVADDRRIIGLLDATGRGVDVSFMPQLLVEHGLTSTVRLEPEHLPGNDINFVDVSDEYETVDTPRPRSRRCDAIIVLVDGRTPVEKATSVIERAEAAPGVLTTLLLRGR